MTRQQSTVRLHMGCGESLSKLLRKEQRRKINERLDGASISTPVAAKRKLPGSGR